MEDFEHKQRTVNVPCELWLLISKFIDPNPLLYLCLARVCQSSRQVFTCDQLWQYLVPVEGPSKGFYSVFEKRFSTKPKHELLQIRANWQSLLEDADCAAAAGVSRHSGRPRRQELSTLDMSLSLCKRIDSPTKVLDTQFWKCALKQSPLLLEHAPACFKTDPDLVLFAIQQARCSPVLLPAGSPVFENLAVAKAAIEHAPNTISKIPTEFIRGHMDLLYRAIELHPWVIIQDSLLWVRDDYQVAELAVSRSGQLLGILSDRLQSNRELVCLAVANYGAALQNAPPELRADRQVVLTAVDNYGMALRYASEQLRDDKAVVLAAVKNNGDARSFASQSLQFDRDIVAAALMSLRS